MCEMEEVRKEPVVNIASQDFAIWARVMRSNTYRIRGEPRIIVKVNNLRLGESSVLYVDK